ncbi:enhancer of mRNA decapping [Blastocladiella emersonii ATCC 22665]|nr:enhancer of mRNA decapping [Blastocladiella emersonii ATCC 22665]
MEFVGFLVCVTTASGIDVRGVVANVDPATRTLSLANVTAKLNDRETQLVALEIPGRDIADLQILADHRTPGAAAAAAATAVPVPIAAQPPTQAPEPETEPELVSPATDTEFHDPAILSFSRGPGASSGGSPSVAVRQFTTSTLPSGRRAGVIPTVDTCESDTSATDADGPRPRSRRPHAQRTLYQGGSPRRNNNNNNDYRRSHLDSAHDTWNLGDVSDYHDSEFDFQANLDRFDKKTVFDEIRRADTIAPEARLVAINRRDPMQAKLAPTENVLAPANGSAASRSATSAPVSGSDTATTTGTGTTPKLTKLRRRKSVFPEVDIATANIRTHFGCAVPTATALQMIEAERIAQTEAFVSEDLMTENAGRSVSMMILQALGGNRRFAARNHNSPPHVVLLCGDNKNGAYTAAAGRFLVSRGARVSVLLASTAATHHALVHQLRMLSAVNVPALADVDDLPAGVPVDMIVDGLLGLYSLREIANDDDRAFVCDLMAWTNALGVPVLSTDVPSGIDATSGAVTFPPHCVRPKWTIAIGIPKAGLRSRDVTGELFLADMGVPAFVWHRAGIHGWPANGGQVWEDKSVVPLEFATPAAAASGTEAEQ